MGGQRERERERERERGERRESRWLKSPSKKLFFIIL
jgi:hypothetical protein